VEEVESKFKVQPADSRILLRLAIGTLTRIRRGDWRLLRAVLLGGNQRRDSPLVAPFYPVALSTYFSTFYFPLFNLERASSRA
jgi:hypothetical protein